MTDTNRLKAKIIECGYTQQSLAPLLGITRQTLSAKINNKSDFLVSEIEKMRTILRIEDMVSYFFCEQNSQNG